MLPDVNQDELTFETTQIWERRNREKSKAYAAFLIYRDLGPSRSLLKAYQFWKAKQGSPDLQRLGDPEKESDSCPPNWRRWRNVYEWDKRAMAWDTVQQKQRETRESEADQIVWEQRRKQKDVLDRLRWDRMLKMNELIDRTLATASKDEKAPGLQKNRIEKEDQNGTITTAEIDLLKQFEILCEQERELVRDYFGATGSVEEMEDGLASIPVTGEFRWVPDPELLGAATSETSSIPPIPASSSSTSPLPDSKA